MFILLLLDTYFNSRCSTHFFYLFKNAVVFIIGYVGIKPLCYYICPLSVRNLRLNCQTLIIHTH